MGWCRSIRSDLWATLSRAVASVMAESLGAALNRQVRERGLGLSRVSFHIAWGPDRQVREGRSSSRLLRLASEVSLCLYEPGREGEVSSHAESFRGLQRRSALAALKFASATLLRDVLVHPLSGSTVKHRFWHCQRRLVAPVSLRGPSRLSQPASTSLDRHRVRELGCSRVRRHRSLEVPERQCREGSLVRWSRASPLIRPSHRAALPCLALREVHTRPSQARRCWQCQRRFIAHEYPGNGLVGIAAVALADSGSIRRRPIEVGVRFRRGSSCSTVGHLTVLPGRSVLSVPRRDAPSEAPACERLFFAFRSGWLIQRRRRAGRTSVGPANLLLHDNAVAPRTAL